MSEQQQEQYTNIRIEANLGEFDDDDEVQHYDFVLCYTNLNGVPERMSLDAEDEADAKFEAAGHCEIDMSYFDDPEKIIWE